MSDTIVSPENKRQSVWGGEDVTEFVDKLTPPKKETPTEPAKVLTFPKK